MENDSIHDFTGITCVKPISSQPPGEISAVLKVLIHEFSIILYVQQQIIAF